MPASPFSLSSSLPASSFSLSSSLPASPFSLSSSSPSSHSHSVIERPSSLICTLPSASSNSADSASAGRQASRGLFFSRSARSLSSFSSTSSYPLQRSSAGTATIGTERAWARTWAFGNEREISAAILALAAGVAMLLPSDGMGAEVSTSSRPRFRGAAAEFADSCAAAIGAVAVAATTDAPSDSGVAAGDAATAAAAAAAAARRFAAAEVPPATCLLADDGAVGRRRFSFHAARMSPASARAASPSQVQSSSGQPNHLTRYCTSWRRFRCSRMHSTS